MSTQKTDCWNRPFFICIPVLQGEEELLEKTLQQFLDNCTGGAEVLVLAVGNEKERVLSILSRLASLNSGVQVAEVKSSGENLLRLALLNIPSRFAAHDILHVRPGVTLPYAWDSRLQWAAYADSDIATVSPMCDLSSLFSLLYPNASSGIADVELINRLAYSLGKKENLEIPVFLPGCVYIRRDALAEVNLKECGAEDFDWLLARLFSLNGFFNVLCDHVYIADQNPGRAEVMGLIESHDHVKAVNRAHPLGRVRHAVNDALAQNVKGEKIPGLDDKPTQLHVMHSWGGGLAKWVTDYCRADDSRTNLVLKSIGNWGEFGQRIALYKHVDDPEPIRFWNLSSPIRATAITHLEYRRILRTLINDYCIDSILVSSLIGHSLDILDVNVKTLLVLHEYYPFCPALNIYFDGVCVNCGIGQLESCFKNNKYNRYFLNISADEWMAIRRRYSTLVSQREISIVVPSESVRHNLTTLEPALKSAKFRVIPHGVDMEREALVAEQRYPIDKIRILVLGRLTPEKGLKLLEEMQKELCQLSELFLVGCGEGGDIFKGAKGVHLLPAYDLKDLPGIVAEIEPDIGLLLSILPESFSYTLSELICLGVPALATNVGSFADRIENGKTGFLCEPDSEAIIQTIRSIKEQPEILSEIRSALRKMEPRTVQEMVAQYHQLMPLPRFLKMLYSTGDGKGVQLDDRDSHNMGVHIPYYESFQEFVKNSYEYLIVKTESSPRLSNWQSYLLQAIIKLGYRLINIMYNLSNPFKGRFK